MATEDSNWNEAAVLMNRNFKNLTEILQKQSYILLATLQGLRGGPCKWGPLSYFSLKWWKPFLPHKSLLGTYCVQWKKQIQMQDPFLPLRNLNVYKSVSPECPLRDHPVSSLFHSLYDWVWGPNGYLMFKRQSIIKNVRET